MKKTLASALSALALAFSGASSAATVTFDFGDILSPNGGYDPVPTFASMSISTLNGGNTSYLFTLSVNSNFSSLFGNNSFISRAIFNTATGADPISTSLYGTGNGVSNVFFSANAPQVGSVGFDFMDCFGTGRNCSYGGNNGRLQAGEQVSWVANFAATQGDPFRFNIPAIALHVQSISNQNISSGWYVPTPAIPEPETYAMLLAGLGLLAFTAKKRRKKEVK